MINRNIFQNQKSLFSPPLSMMHDGGCRHMSDVVKIIAVSQQNVDGVRLCCRIVLKLSLAAGGTPRQRRMERRPPADLLPFVARNHARQAKPDRALAPLSMLATLAPPAANAAWRGGRGAEEKVRGAEPSCGFAARRLKRAGRGYMLPSARVPHGLSLRQRTLPPMPEERNTSRTEPST